MPSIINATLTNGLVTSADNSGSLQLQTNNGTTAVTIDTSQRVGVNTTSPTATLQVFAQDNQANKALRVAFDGTYYSDITENALHCYNNPLTIETVNNFQMAFKTNATERMRITSGGFVGINNNNPSWLLTASNTGTSPRIAVEQTADTSCDMITFRRNGSERGKINVTDSATQYQTSSDYRLKENIKPLTNALETVAKLKPSSFTWIQERGGKEDNGFIAHELQEVLPNAVTGEKDAVDEEGKPIYQGVDTSFLVATLTAAIQEQQAQIEELKTKVSALEGVK